jgi:hypothetical protein
MSGAAFQPPVLAGFDDLAQVAFEVERGRGDPMTVGPLSKPQNLGPTPSLR